MNRPTAWAGAALLLTLVGAVDAQQPRDGKAALPDRIIGLDPRWTISIAATLAAPAGFDQQMAYMPLKDGELIAIGLDDGAVRWKVPLQSPFTPATGDGIVFVGHDRQITALDQSTGQTVWRADATAAWSGPLFWDSGSLFASTEAGELIAFDAADGRELWRNPLGSPLAVHPAAAEDRLFVALRDGRLAAVDANSGATLWSLALDEPVSGMLALREQLLVGSRANRLHSVSPDRGRIRWTFKAGADLVGDPAADDERVYFVAFDNVLRSLDRGSGNLQWTRNLPSRPSSGPQRVEHLVLVPFSTPVIGAYLASTGAEAFSVRAVEELRGAPFLREHARPTMPRLVALSRLGALQGFAPRVEPPPVPLPALPGVAAGH